MLGVHGNGAEHLSDDHLVDAARRGCTRSFEILVERYYTTILNYLNRRIEDCETARDLTQQTFLDAFRDINRLSLNSHFVAWLYRIARNNFLPECRKQRTRRNVSLEWLVDEVKIHPSQTADPTHLYHQRLEIEQTLGSLSSTLRSALLLSELPGDRAATILGISHAALRQRICRAKAEFRRQYQALNYDDC